MLRLVSVNVEGIKHHETVIPFLNEHNPDIICLQEVTDQLLRELRNQGYITSFLPMCHRDYGTMGIGLASKIPFGAYGQYYHGGEHIRNLDQQNKAATESFGYLIGSLTLPNGTYRVATTHFWDSPHGAADSMQQTILSTFLPMIATELPHVLCRDFNIPRGHNVLYDKLAIRYNESIPLHYKSSLDRNLHRLGKAKLDQPIFDQYMVDYVLTQQPYIATDTKLHFGVSDHAAVSSTIIIRP